jgi:hypothetical protein
VRVYWAALHEYTNTLCVLLERNIRRKDAEKRASPYVAKPAHLTHVVEKTFSRNLSPPDAGTRRSSRRIVSAVPHIHHHHSSSSSLSRVRARARTNTLARDGSRASRRTRRRRAETGRDRAVGTGASSRSRGPRCRRHRRVRSRSRAQPVCSYDRVSVDARLTPRPTPTRTQANAARGFSVTTAGRAGMGSPVPAHEPPTGPVRTEVERRCAIEDIIPKPQPA